MEKMVEEKMADKSAGAKLAAAFGAAIGETNKESPYEHVCIELPLYTRFEIDDRQFMSIFREQNFQFDAHCVQCGKDSTFRTMRTVPNKQGSFPYRSDDWMLSDGEIRVDLFCQRYRHHAYSYLFVYRGGSLIKFGQLPSIEDIAGADLRQYEKVMPKGYFNELKRAGGLASHGIGIGSFVYLRRIFERLIYDHHSARQVSIEGFDDMWMDQKIAALKDDLPPALVENKTAYGILSKGIHELDEETCRKYFPVVRQAIITILEQDLQARQKDEQSRRLRQALADINGEVKARGGKE